MEMDGGVAAETRRHFLRESTSRVNKNYFEILDVSMQGGERGPGWGGIIGYPPFYLAASISLSILYRTTYVSQHLSKTSFFNPFTMVTGDHVLYQALHPLARE